MVANDFLEKNRPMDGDESGTAGFDIGPFEYDGVYIPLADEVEPDVPTDTETGNRDSGCFVSGLLAK